MKNYQFLTIFALFAILYIIQINGSGEEKKDQTPDFDTIVVGAGIMGSGCAYKIAQTGRRTLLLEQFPLDHKLGSSHGASRIIRLSHSQPHWIPLARDAYQQWDRLHDLDGGEPLYIQNGLLTMDTDWVQTALRAAQLRRFSVPHEVLRGGASIGARFPHLCNYGPEWSAVYEPGAGTMFAERCLQTIQKHFLAFGPELSQIRDNERVLAIVPRNHSLVEIQTSKGGWLPRLFPDLPLRTLPELVGVDFWRVKSRPELFRPVPGGSPNLVTYEQGMELFAQPGVDNPDMVKFAIHAGMAIEEMERRDGMEAQEWVHALVAQHLARHLPDLDSTAPAVKSTCVYTMTDDLNFIVDRHPAHPRALFIVGGFSGTGFKFALTVGTVLAHWVNGEEAPAHIDVSAFRLDRKIGANGGMKQKL